MVELPSHIILPIVMAVITYFMVGYQLAADKFWRVVCVWGAARSLRAAAHPPARLPAAVTAVSLIPPTLTRRPLH